MVFLNSSYLWALLGLAVPVAIHLWSRKEGRTIKIGSIQLLKESDPKHASSIKLNEVWLLLMRLLALSVLVIIMAGPVIKSEGSRSALTYLVEPSLLQHDEMKRILDTIDSGVKLFAEDFPDYTGGEEINTKKIPDYWQLAGEMEDLNSDSIVVFTAGYAAGLIGSRPEIDQHINWIQIIPDENINEPITAIRKGDEFEIINVSGDHTRLDIEKEITPVTNNDVRTTGAGDSIVIIHRGTEKLIPLRIADTLRISLFNDEEQVEQMRYIRSSFRAISEYLRTPIMFAELSSEDNIPAEQDLLIWLSSSAPYHPEFPVLLWKPDSLSNSLIEPGNRNNVYYLTRPLDSENITGEHLPEQLMQILNINEELQKEIAEYDRRVMPMEEILPVAGSLGRNLNISNSEDISKYLWLLLGILLIAERGLSFYRKQ